MDMITLSMAKKYTDERQLGYITRTKTSVLMSNAPSDAPTFSEELIGGSSTKIYVRVLEEAINVETIPVMRKFADGGFTVIKRNAGLVSVPSDEISVAGQVKTIDDGVDVWLIVIHNTSMGIPVGTYFYKRADSTTYLDFIEYESETVHTIDPKYLPGVCLPVVELSTEPTAEGATLTAEESALMDALSGAPCIIKFPHDGMTTYCCPSAMSADGVVAYYLNCADAILVLGYEGGTWVFARP